MNWRMIAGFGAVCGILMAALAILGWLPTPRLELDAWIVAGTLTALNFKRVGGRVFLGAFLAGVAMGVVRHALILLFWGAYAEHNQRFIAQMTGSVQGMNARMAMLVGLVPISLGWGGIIGFVAWAFSKLIKEPAAASLAPLPGAAAPPDDSQS